MSSIPQPVGQSRAAKAQSSRAAAIFRENGLTLVLLTMFLLSWVGQTLAGHRTYNNDRREIDAELEAKIPTVKERYGYVLHSDHSIPNNVHPDTYRYFIQKGLELGRY